MKYMVAMRVMFCIGLFMPGLQCPAQIRTEWIDSTAQPEADVALFFTNRPLEYDPTGKVTFKDKSTEQTDNLYFCMFDYESDSIHLKYRAFNTSNYYPTEKVAQNFLYKALKDIRHNRGITKFYFIVPGYSKTFSDQVYDFMYRLKTKYGDALSSSTAIIMYAWGDEWRPYMYWPAKRSARRGGNDFAIFQHMLEEVLTDTAFVRSYLNDVEVNLVCTSMGNQLLKKYLLAREKEEIPLVKTYEDITFIGSDASWDSFESGKGFHDLGQMTDTVHVFVNSKDGPLQMSQRLNTQPRMGLMGPRLPSELPGFVRVHVVTDLISREDLPAMGHDYLLRNPVVYESFLQQIQTKQTPERIR